MHLSLHASGEWHLKVGRKHRVVWVRLGEVIPGYTLVVGVVQPAVVAHCEDPAPDDVVLNADATTFVGASDRSGRQDLLCRRTATAAVAG